MRPALALLIPLLLAGCAGPSTRSGEANRSNRPILDRLQLTLDIRYRMGQTLSKETQVSVVCGTEHISTKLKECGMTPANDFIRYTTGGIVRPGLPCQVLLAQPGEPSQLFVLPTPKKNDRLGVWFDWRKPEAQIVSPMPVHALLNVPKARQPLTIPAVRRFEVRYQLTALHSAYDPKAD
jgi:hypothetical protein